MEHSIRMVGLALDGTVFTNAKQITEHTKEVLTRAIEKGVIVLPATGRPACGVPQDFLDIPGVRYALTSNGARVVDVKNGETVYEESIPWDLALKILAFIENWEHSAWEIYFDGKVYVEEGVYHFLEHPEMSQGYKEYMYRSRVFVPNLRKQIGDTKQRLEKIHIVFDDTPYRDEKFKEIYEAFPELNHCCSTIFDIDVNMPKAEKGTALLELGKILGISREEIMACGDAKNDWDMLKKAGFPVAMANADEETKKLAKFITRSNEEDGVAWAVEKFVLKES